MISNLFKLKAPAIIFSGALAMTACSCDDKGKDDDEGYTVPSTYNFINVSYSGQTDRLNMLEEMTTYLKSGANEGTILDRDKLAGMFRNNNDAFENADLNASTKQLFSKCFALDTGIYKMVLDGAVGASISTETASAGVAGRATTNADKKYLFDPAGWEPAQLWDKGIMGAVFYYQITSVYLGEDKIGNGVDNTEVTEGKGTAMEHHWDEAFGYFGVPIDFPTNKEGIRFWGKYCDKVDEQLGTSKALMDAFLTGRAAISNKDMTKKDEMAGIIKSEMEKVVAGTAIHYLNAYNANGDAVAALHELSEAIAFIRGLKYNAEGSFTGMEIDAMLATIGMNAYAVDKTKVSQVIDQISARLGMDAVKHNL